MKKIIVLLASLLGMSSAFADVPAVSPQQAAQMQSEKKAVIIDVREKDEWNAADILAKSGFTNVHNMDGGLNAWQKANLKTIQAN
jgi:rhodanese-related sulfurtransferase